MIKTQPYCNCCGASLCGCMLKHAPMKTFSRVAVVEFESGDAPLSKTVKVSNVYYSFTLRPHQNFEDIATFRAIVAASDYLKSIGNTDSLVVSYVIHKAA